MTTYQFVILSSQITVIRHTSLSFWATRKFCINPTLYKKRDFSLATIDGFGKCLILISRRITIDIGISASPLSYWACEESFFIWGRVEYKILHCVQNDTGGSGMTGEGGIRGIDKNVVWIQLRTRIKSWIILSMAHHSEVDFKPGALGWINRRICYSFRTI